jgi:hypothetical protein
MVTSNRVLPFGRRAQSWFCRAMPPGACVPHSHIVLPSQSSSPTVRLLNLPPRRSGPSDSCRNTCPRCPPTNFGSITSPGTPTWGQRRISLPFIIDEVRRTIGGAEADEAVVGAGRVIDRHACRVYPGRGRGHTGDSTIFERQNASTIVKLAGGFTPVGIHSSHYPAPANP